jgi:hypothetical protein
MDGIALVVKLKCRKEHKRLQGRKRKTSLEPFVLSIRANFYQQNHDYFIHTHFIKSAIVCLYNPFSTMSDAALNLSQPIGSGSAELSNSSNVSFSGDDRWKIFLTNVQLYKLAEIENLISLNIEQLTNERTADNVSSFIKGINPTGPVESSVAYNVDKELYNNLFAEPERVNELLSRLKASLLSYFRNNCYNRHTQLTRYKAMNNELKQEQIIQMNSTNQTHAQTINTMQLKHLEELDSAISFRNEQITALQTELQQLDGVYSNKFNEKQAELAANKAQFEVNCEAQVLTHKLQLEEQYEHELTAQLHSFKAVQRAEAQGLHLKIDELNESLLKQQQRHAELVQHSKENEVQMQEGYETALNVLREGHESYVKQVEADNRAIINSLRAEINNYRNETFQTKQTLAESTTQITNLHFQLQQGHENSVKNQNSIREIEKKLEKAQSLAQNQWKFDELVAKQRVEVERIHREHQEELERALEEQQRALNAQQSRDIGELQQHLASLKRRYIMREENLCKICRSRAIKARNHFIQYTNQVLHNNTGNNNNNNNGYDSVHSSSAEQSSPGSDEESNAASSVKSHRFPALHALSPKQAAGTLNPLEAAAAFPIRNKASSPIPHSKKNSTEDNKGKEPAVGHFFPDFLSNSIVESSFPSDLEVESTSNTHSEAELFESLHPAEVITLAADGSIKVSLGGNASNRRFYAESHKPAGTSVFGSPAPPPVTITALLGSAMKSPPIQLYKQSLQQIKELSPKPIQPVAINSDNPSIVQSQPNLGIADNSSARAEEKENLSSSHLELMANANDDLEPVWIRDSPAILQPAEEQKYSHAAEAVIISEDDAEIELDIAAEKKEHVESFRRSLKPRAELKRVSRVFPKPNPTLPIATKAPAAALTNLKGKINRGATAQPSTFAQVHPRSIYTEMLDNYIAKQQQIKKRNSITAANTNPLSR